MTWLIVGYKGQLSTALRLVLEEANIDFCVLGSSELDIRISDLCIKKIAELKPSVIINTAAWTNVDSAELDPFAANAVNNLGAMNLALAAKSIGAIFLHISTDYVFSDPANEPRKELDPLSPNCVYGKTKAAGEISVLREYRDHSFIFRTAWLYSQWGNNFVKTMTRLAMFGKEEVRVVFDQVGQPTSVFDLANQIVETVRAKLPFGIYHASNSGQSSRFDCAFEVFKLCEASTSRLVPIETKDLVQLAKRPAFSVLSHDGWNAVGASGMRVAPMREWKAALYDLMPDIINSVRSEK
jgi:dTDP-4-dehydrorhamnose reductase